MSTSTHRLLAQSIAHGGPLPISIGNGLRVNNNALELDLGTGLQVGADAKLAALAGASLAAYGAGTAYSLTNTAAALALGTTPPTKILTVAGTYLLLAFAQLKAAAATIVAETVTLKLRRTNNTAADLTNGGVTLNLPILTIVTQGLGLVQLPPVLYTTANIDDSISIFGSVSATLGAGTIDIPASGTGLLAIQLL